MNRDEAEAAHHAAFLDKQERVFQRRQQVGQWSLDRFSKEPLLNFGGGITSLMEDFIALPIPK